MDVENKKNWISGFSVGAVLFLAIHYLLKLPYFETWDNFRPFLSRLSTTAFTILLVLLIGRVIEKIIEDRGETEGDRYNLLRITRLLTFIVVGFVIISFFIQKPYATFAGVGLISVVLGFALQAPVTSFIGWLYIILRKPYLVGDRVQLKGMRGDVIEVHYLDTLIRECSGDYIGNDHESGRIIRFPNSVVLTTEITNYTGELMPFIWNDTALQISYTSDIEFVETCLLKAANDDFKEQYPHRASQKRPEWASNVYFRSNSYAWMEALISYPVEPYDTTGRRNRILRKAMPLLNENPNKVQFPEGRRR